MTVVTVLITSMGISENFICKWKVDIKIKEKSKKEMKKTVTTVTKTPKPLDI